MAEASRAGRARTGWGGVRGHSGAEVAVHFTAGVTIEALSARARVRGLDEGSVLPLPLQRLPLCPHLSRRQWGASWVSQPPCPVTGDDQAGCFCLRAPPGPRGQPPSGQHISLLRGHCTPFRPFPGGCPCGPRRSIQPHSWFEFSATGSQAPYLTPSFTGQSRLGCMARARHCPHPTPLSLVVLVCTVGTSASTL